MNEVAVRLLKGLEENKEKYKKFSNDVGFNFAIDHLKKRLQCGKKFPCDEVIHDYERYLVYLRDLSITVGEDGFWKNVCDVKTIAYEISEDFIYFVVRIGDSTIYKYDAKTGNVDFELYNKGVKVLEKKYE